MTRPKSSETARLGFALAAAIGLAAGLAACEGCHATKPTPPAQALADVAPDVGPSTLRFYIVSDLAGALEPCGCVKDQLGGLDHASAWMASEKGRSASSALVTAGPLFFLDSMLDDDKRPQEVAKAETLAAALKALGFAAFAPGRNDWAAGPSVLGELAAASGGALVFGNARAVAAGGDAGAGPFGKSAPVPFAIREMNGVKVGFVGVSAPDKDREAPPVPGLEVTPAIDAVRASVAAAEKAGAKILVALAAVGRGEAKRIADAVPQLTAVVVGSPGRGGDLNTKTPPAERVGNVIIAETGNHLQTVAVLDLFVRDGSLAFADASGIEQSQKREELSQRINELRRRIAQWETDGKIAKKDLDARRADVAKWEAERAAIDVKPPPDKGSFFRYTVKEIRDNLGRDPTLAQTLLAYYKRVNDENKRDLAGRMPRPVPEGQAGYVGIKKCSECHPGARAVWDKTGHAHAYATLSSQFKEFNLDCVSCHVTGYERPGGSTVTHVAGLTDVQCEVCHGPGSKHVKSGGNKALIVGKPSPETCLECHHPPHVHEFNAALKMADILGPGHGRPMK